MGGEIDDAVVGERGTLQRGLAGVAAEMNVGRGNAEILCDRVQLVGGIGQLRQRLREPDSIDAGAAPEFGIGAGHHAARRGLGRGAPLAALL